MNRIKELRESKNIKQIELAKTLNVSQGTLSNWERGIHDPDSDSLFHMAQIFDVSIDFLLGRDSDKELDDLAELFSHDGFSLEMYDSFGQNRVKIKDIYENIVVDDVTLEFLTSNWEFELRQLLTLKYAINPYQRSNQTENAETPIITNPDIRLIARAGKKLSNDQAEQLRKYAEFMFPEAFK